MTFRTNFGQFKILRYQIFQRTVHKIAQNLNRSGKVELMSFNEQQEAPRSIIGHRANGGKSGLS